MDADILRHDFRTLHDRVIVEVDVPQETMSKGGIIIPAPDAKGEGNTRESMEGRVVAVGKGVWCSRGKKRWFAPTRAEVGQRVVFRQAAAFHIPTSFEASKRSTLFYIHDDEIEAVIDGTGDIVSASDEAAA